MIEGRSDAPAAVPWSSASNRNPIDPVSVGPADHTLTGPKMRFE